MSALLLILLSAGLVSVACIVDAGRWRPFANTADVYGASVGLAQVHVVALPVISGLTWLLSFHVLQPLELHYLRTPAFVAIALAVAATIEVALQRRGTLLPSRPGLALLLSANSAVLGVAIMSDTRTPTLGHALLFSFSAAVAFALLLLTSITLYERIRYADVPAPFRDAPIALITAGLIALACMGFTGLIQE